MKRVVLFLPLLWLSLTCLSQHNSCEISMPIEVSQNGWNKILQLNKGNTLLFHFEDKKGILVKVFDKTHREIASENHIGKHIDLRALERSFYDGLFDINNEAVLFITQQVHDTESLFRMRFDANTGKLLAEENLSAISGFEPNTLAFVLKGESEEGYHTVAFAKGSIENAGIYLRSYNKTHNLLRSVPLSMVKKGYDYIHLLSQEIDKTGAILITVELDKVVQYPDVIEKYIVLYYLPKGAEKFNAKILKMPPGAKDFNIRFSENSYASTVNVFLSSLVQQKKDAGEEEAIFFYQAMLIADQEMNALDQLELKNKKATEYIKQTTGKDAAYAGNILLVNTNNKGNTMVANEDLLSKTDNNGNNAGYISLTEYDYEGSEKWATVVPKALSKTKATDLSSSEVFKVRTSAYELSQLLCLNAGNNYYLIYNDLDDNFGQGTGENLKMIADYDKTNAVCYQLNKKKEINKTYLFGIPSPGEYKRIYTHSGDFDKRRSVYATVMLYNKGGHTTTHIAWCKMD